MVVVSVNTVKFEFDDNVTFETVIKAAMKHPNFKKLTISKPVNLLYVNNNQIVKYEELIKQEAKDGDELSVLVFLTGG